MKTKEEILVHLIENGYTKEAVTKIMGFLIGAGIKENDEHIFVRMGENTWGVFYSWVTGQTDETLEEILTNLANAIEQSINEINQCLEKNKEVIDRWKKENTQSY